MSHGQAELFGEFAVVHGSYRTRISTVELYNLIV
jgi:hypothetical protein